MLETVDSLKTKCKWAIRIREIAGEVMSLYVWNAKTLHNTSPLAKAGNTEYLVIFYIKKCRTISIVQIQQIFNSGYVKQKNSNQLNLTIL